ncbi:NAD-dependent protein deacetylase sirtuin-7-like [Diadema antillarum]|uniref:NAD-dependent protein deacetylase sirtuin-7-like n=1 Tax=Diadema antillarum TaxID=105358 RepID=UPI003A876192
MSDNAIPPSKRPVRRCRNTSSKPWKSKRHETKEKEREVQALLKKDPWDRTDEEEKIIKRNRKIVKTIEKRAKLKELLRYKSQEFEDSTEELEEKVAELAKVIDTAEHLVVYTGAGISTAASIPDYRGPNGVWTLLQQGKASSLQNNSLVDAKPTVTHMSLSKLVQDKKIKHVVSQNCDGLHLRSGIPAEKLSELHGNMYIEACTECDPEREYVRLFDVTEQTSLRRHKTGRSCPKCGEPLRDTIVHFGEKGAVKKPLNWAGAVDAAEEADAILCLGSSLKVLRRYQCLWNTDKPKKQRPKLYIVNLQWTPKDSQATLKINGRCDDVMVLVMKRLGLTIPRYTKSDDPIFKMATPLRHEEEDSFTTKTLVHPTDRDDTSPHHNTSNQGKGELDAGKFAPDSYAAPGCKMEESERASGDAQTSGLHGNMPGWFGKGYRKKVPKRVAKRRRRSRMSSDVPET